MSEQNGKERQAARERETQRGQDMLAQGEDLEEGMLQTSQPMPQRGPSVVSSGMASSGSEQGSVVMPRRRRRGWMFGKRTRGSDFEPVGSDEQLGSSADEPPVGWCGVCLVGECVAIAVLLFVVVILALVIKQNVCWTSEDELNLYLSLGHEATLYGRNLPVPLVHAHSHNDYLQAAPVKLALSAGFCSIEADVFVRDGDLFTGHVVPSDHHLTQQYLEPLAELSKANDRGPINPLSMRTGLCLQHTLLVDMKSDPFATWEALETLVAKVNERFGMRVFECYSGNGTALPEPRSLTGKSPVQIVLSGISKAEIPLLARRLLESGQHCAKIDGRWEADGTVSEDPDTRLVLGMLSGKWDSSLDDQELRRRVARGHAVGARLRFWDTPEDFGTWHALLSAGVDLISTDRIAGLQAFLLGRPV